MRADYDRVAQTVSLKDRANGCIRNAKLLKLQRYSARNSKQRNNRLLLRMMAVGDSILTDKGPKPRFLSCMLWRPFAGRCQGTPDIHLGSDSLAYCLRLDGRRYLHVTGDIRCLLAAIRRDFFKYLGSQE